MNHAESSALLRRAQAGSREALNALFEQHAARLLAFIRLRLGRKLRENLESRDILNATLLKAFLHIEKFEKQDSKSLMAWLVPIAANEIKDQAAYHGRQRRDAARVTRLDEGFAEVAAELRSQLSQLILDQQTQQIEAALETLKPDHREVILLRKFEELSFEEIAERLGRSADACRMLLARALTALTLALRGS